MHHEAAIHAGRTEYELKDRNGNEPADLGNGGQNRRDEQRKCVNLDGWMMRTPSALIASYIHHTRGAHISILEGSMGLHDSKNGTSEEGSAAQIAKWLGIPVVLVVDGGRMARSVAAMLLGYGMLDGDVRLGASVVNRVGGSVHIRWIREAIEMLGDGSGRGHNRGHLKDVETGESILFAGALPSDTSAAVAERHLGLVMPTEQKGWKKERGQDPDLERFVRLAVLVEQHLDLDALYRLAQTASMPIFSNILSKNSGLKLSIERQGILQPIPTSKRCRIGIAQDEAFCFYYMDNLRLLEVAGAKLVPFSPISSRHLPPELDGLYIGGGYPELHAQQLECNQSLRDDIRSFCRAGGAVLAECGGLMYLADKLLVSKNESRDMCGVLPITVRMTPHMKMYYADIEFTASNPLFPAGGKCRGQKFHFSEIINVNGKIKENGENQYGINYKDIPKMINSPLLVTPELPESIPEHAGFSTQNTFASYFHSHFSSFLENDVEDKNQNKKIENEPILKTLAEHFVETAILNSPHRKAFAVSFVSAATEVIFALGAQSTLAGVTSICDYPPEAQCAPRQIVCRSPIDAASMTSEEVDVAMNEIRLRRVDDKGPPGHWKIDTEALGRIDPKVVFVQNTCDICDPASDDVLHALKTACLDTKLTSTISIAPTTLEGLFESIEKIASVLDLQEDGSRLMKNFRKRLERINDQVSKMNSSPPKIISLEGLMPLCVAGHWYPDMKKAAGCIDALGDEGGCPARHITWEEIVSADPDILLISPCSASPTRTLNEMHLLASAPEFWSLRCVQQGNIYIIDHGCFARPGPRLIEGVEMMAALFRGVLPPSPSYYSRWKGQALKYQCCASSDRVNSISHCTTLLAAQFAPCFEDQKDHFGNSAEELVREKTQKNIKFCNVTRCTIPGFQLPSNRSAHCFVPVNRKGSKQTSLLLVGGESDIAKRLKDTWELHPPANGWSAISELDTTKRSFPEIGTSATWEHLICGKVAGEDVPTPRSNHAAVACGAYILIFGGWGVDNVTPLSNCELLHTDTLCWTHCSTQGSSEPGPRGNPTLVFQQKTNSIFLFGGWNGKHALNDLWCLDMNEWEWQNLTQQIEEKGDWPSPRTDHTSVLWERKEQCDKMLVFGGNIEGFGSCSELWVLEFPRQRQKNEIFNNEEFNIFQWSQLKISGLVPPARTSHSAAIVGKGNDKKMVIVGGTDSSRGVGWRSMLCDAWVLNLAEVEHDHDCLMWIKLDWSGNGLNRCRHSMAAVDTNSVIWWGGYDGDKTVDDYVGIWQGCIDTPVDVCTFEATESIEFSEEKEEHLSTVQERWEAEVPVRVEDLPPETLAKANRSKFPGAVYKALHRYAVTHNRDTYIDPSSGYSVFSQIYLKRRPCCGNGCRHCPHGHINVPGKREKSCNEGINSDLEW